MNLDTIFSDVLITEMARADLKGAGDALVNKDWAKAAKIYVKNAQGRGLEDSKLVSGLGSTFRAKKGESTVTVGKTEDGTAITLTTDDIAAMKKAVKSFMGFETKASKKKKETATKVEDKVQADIEKDKKNLRDRKKEEVKEHTAKNEIFRNIKYADYYLRKETKKVSKTDKIIGEALKNTELKDAIKDALENKTQKQINQLLEK